MDFHVPVVRVQCLAKYTVDEKLNWQVSTKFILLKSFMCNNFHEHDSEWVERLYQRNLKNLCVCSGFSQFYHWFVTVVIVRLSLMRKTNHHYFLNSADVCW